jgi:hypothetical protein
MRPLTRRSLLVVALAPALSARARVAPPSELAPALPGARLQGEGRLSFFGLPVYEARLWAPAPVTADRWAEEPLALELVYERTLRGRKIAERSLEEMRRQVEIPAARAQRWLGEMSSLFPDVGDGDRLTGVYLPARSVRFFHNGRPLGEIPDALFARLFFGIWLSAQTSEPALRDRLLGLGR